MDRNPDIDVDRWVAELGTPHRARRAYWKLVLHGACSMEAVRRGTRSPYGDVRMHGARILDHIVDEAAFGHLLPVLDDEDARVRVQALHALA